MLLFRMRLAGMVSGALASNLYSRSFLCSAQCSALSGLINVVRPAEGFIKFMIERDLKGGS